MNRGRCRSIFDVWAIESAAGNKFFERIRRIDSRGHPTKDQFKNLAAGDLFILSIKNQKLSIAAVAEVARSWEEHVEKKPVLCSMLPHARHNAFDEYLGQAAFDFVSLSKVWDLRRADFTVPTLTARIGVREWQVRSGYWRAGMTILTALPCIVEPEVRRYWEFGLVDCWAVIISAGSEVHQRLLSLLAQYPGRANEPSVRMPPPGRLWSMESSMSASRPH